MLRDKLPMGCDASLYLAEMKPISIDDLRTGQGCLTREKNPQLWGPDESAPSGPEHPPAGKEKVNRRVPNKTEAAYRRAYIDTRDDVAAVYYEGLMFRMDNGHRYTPDFIVVTKTGTIECHEVKGRYALHSQQRARLAFDQARIEFPWAKWIWAKMP